MKIMMKKTVSLLLVFVICFGIALGVNTSVKAASYIYNWGVRGDVATYLSQQAEDFYADNNTSYAQLSSLSGSSTESGVPSSALYKKLHNLMESNHDNITSYNDTKDLFKYTDCQNGGGKISSFYSGIGIGPSWDGSWNREHTWPNSKGDASGSGENDLMMLRPTSTSENSSRGNKAYGQGNGYYNPNSESNGQYDLRGDVARIVLYVYVRWECTNTGSGYNPNGIFGTDGVMESKQVLLDWIEQDPVDTWELGRNDSAESILGTRNVFVDYPELAFLLYNEDIPTDYTTPSGSAVGNQYTITASSNNTSWGTVSVSGKTVNATPKTGYEVAGYELISGEATVTRSGNSFTVVADSDVQIRINFAARTQKNIKFSEDGIINSQTVYSGDEITLPAYSGTLQDGNTFVGWVENSIQETTEIPTYYTAGSKYTVTSDVTLYALYSKNVTDGGTSSNVFEKYSGELVPGDYIITFEGGAMKAASTGANRLQIADIDDSGNEMIVTDESLIWKLAKEGSYWTFYNESTGKYAAGTGTKNTAKLLDSVDDFARWTASGNSTYEFVNLGNDAKGVNPLLRKNPGVGFACYAKNTNVGGANTLYKRISGSIYYFTSMACDHSDAYNVDAIEPNCSEYGYTAGVYCPSCDEYISGHEVIEEYGNHSYSSDCDTSCNVCVESRKTYTVHSLDDNYNCVDCGVQVESYRVADINNDGKINTRDYVIVVRYINDWDIDITINAADVNGDGVINGRDCALLIQYINGWDVTIGS